jgi:hypothetical protein
MSKSMIVKCDVCQAERTPTNHWFLVWIQSIDERPVPEFCVRMWDEDKADAPGVLHVCGQEHVTVLQSRWFSGLTLEYAAIVVNKSTQQQEERSGN